MSRPLLGETARKVRGYRADDAVHTRLQAEAERQGASVNDVIASLVATLPELPKANPA